MEELSREFFRCICQLSKIRMNGFSKELSQKEFMMLSKIDYANRNHGGINISEIAEQLKTLPPAVSRSLNALEERGLIERVVRKTDRRNTYVVLTNEGEEAFYRAREELNNFVETVIEQVGEADMKQLLHTLDAIYYISEKELEKRRERREGMDEKNI